MLRVDPQQLDQLLHPVLDPSLEEEPGEAGQGPAGLAGRRRRAPSCSPPTTRSSSPSKAPVILVRKETVPDDIHGMEVAKGILTARGGMTSHAAVVCRGMGTPCVAGAESFTVSEAKKEVNGHGGRQDVRRCRKATGFRSTAPPARSSPARPTRWMPTRLPAFWPPS